MAFSSGLSVPTMSTHHPAGQREVDRTRNREREGDRVKPKLPKATWSSLPTEEGATVGCGESAPPPPFFFRGQGSEEDECPLQERWGAQEPQGHGWDTNTHRPLLSSSLNLCQGESTQSSLFKLWSGPFPLFGSFSRRKWCCHKLGSTTQLSPLNGQFIVYRYSTHINQKGIITQFQL